MTSDLQEKMTPGAALCMPCGICCDGTLFGHAYLHDWELDFARELHLSVVETVPYKRFVFPCPKFRGHCSIYEQARPKVCGDFSCKLLKRYRDGLVSLEDALEIVRRAREQQAALALLLPGEVPVRFLMRIMRAEVDRLNQAGEAARRERVDFLMRAAKYEMFILSHFVFPRPRTRKPAEGMSEQAAEA